MFDSAAYREKLLASLTPEKMALEGWELFSVHSQPAHGLYYLVIGLCELTGEVLKGSGMYDPAARWVTWNLDTNAPRLNPGTGWCYLDAQAGVVLSDKDIVYYKKIPAHHRHTLKYQWIIPAQ